MLQWISSIVIVDFRLIPIEQGISWRYIHTSFTDSNSTTIVESVSYTNVQKSTTVSSSGYWVTKQRFFPVYSWHKQTNTSRKYKLSIHYWKWWNRKTHLCSPQKTVLWLWNVNQRYKLCSFSISKWYHMIVSNVYTHIYCLTNYRSMVNLNKWPLTI